MTKVKAAAIYKGIPFSHQEHVGIAELKKLNPVTGKVPIAVIDGEVVVDSSLILRRFDKIKPSPTLVSPNATIAAQQYLLEDWSDESLYWYVQALRWCDKNEHRTIAENSRFVPAPVRMFAKPLLRRLVGRQPLAQGLGRLPYEMLIAEVSQRLDNLVQVLGASPFFYSDKPSVADFAIYGVCTTGFWGATPDFAERFSERAALVDWCARMDGVIVQ